MKKGLKKFIAAALMMAGVAICGGGVAYAEGGSSLRVSPSGTRLTLEAGKVLEGTAEGCVNSISEGCFIQVQNNGSEAFRFKVYVTPYIVSGSENSLSFSDERGSAYAQIARWIDVKNADGEYVKEAEFAVEPGQTQDVHYRVTIPEDIPGGSQYAVLWAQILSDENATGIQTVGQVGSVITGRSTADTRETAEVSNIDLTTFSFGGTLHAEAKVKNTGNTDFEIKYNYKASTFFGKEIHSQDGTMAAYPETEYDISMDWEDTPFLGIFQVEFTVHAADQNVVERHIVVIMPIFAMILLILLLTVVVVWIIIMVRKRKEQKARKLV